MVFSRRNAQLPPVRRGVSDDWFRALPREKTELFDTVVRRWECTYAMMSVTLDESFSARARGELVCARQQVSIAADLLVRLTASLVSFCDALSARGRRIRRLPVVEPLKTNFFRSNTGQSAASWNAILHRVLFASRSRFIHKLRILSDTIERLDRDFAETAGDLSKGLSTQPRECWERLDVLHYDFNTCLREAEVVLKSFLRALPEEQLPAFAIDLDAPPTPKRLRISPRVSDASA